MPNRRKILTGLTPTVLVSITGCITIESSPDSNSDSDSESNTGDGSESDIDIEEFEETDNGDMEDLPSEEETDEQDDQESVEEQIEEDLEGEEPVEDPETTSSILDQSSRRVTAGEYFYWEFELFKQSTLNLRTTVRNGPNVGIFVMLPREFQQFENNNRYRFYEDISQENTVGDDTSQTLPSGNYIILVYNNSNSTATVDIELTATG